ncbi:MAG: hypothetical protein GQ557_00640 [Mycoplasmataceae bacterium]|nr:hypothetical protein [Mycoplasmataceae bacterium]
MNNIEMFKTIREMEEITTTGVAFYVVFSLVAILFLALAIFFLWTYFAQKQYKQQKANAVSHRSPWSFKGFWGRYNTQIYFFLAFLFALIAISLIMIMFNIDPGSDYSL